MKYNLSLVYIITLFLLGCSDIHKSTTDSLKKDEVIISLFPIRYGDKWGYIDSKGKNVIISKFNYADYFFEEVAIVENNEGLIGFIDSVGNYVIEPSYQQATRFSNGLSCVVLEGGWPAFVNKKGDVIIDLTGYDGASKFFENRALVLKDNKFGYIDLKGNVVVEPKFDYALPFQEGHALVGNVIDDKFKYGFIDTVGNLKIKMSYTIHKVFEDFPPDNDKFGFYSGKAIVSADGINFVVINKKEEIVTQSIDLRINPTDRGAPYFKKGLCMMKNGDFVGFIDVEEKFQIPPKFKKAYEFSDNGLSAVCNQNGKWGFIDTSGNVQISFDFDQIFYPGFIGEVAFVKINNKFEMINKQGKPLTKLNIDDVLDYSPYNNIIHNFVISDYFDFELLFSLAFENEQFIKLNKCMNFNNLQDVMSNLKDFSLDNLSNNQFTFEIKDDNLRKYGVSDLKLKIVFANSVYISKTRYKKVWKKGFNGQSYVIDEPITDKILNEKTEIESINYRFILNQIDDKIKVSNSINDYLNKNGWVLNFSDKAKNKNWSTYTKDNFKIDFTETKVKDGENYYVLYNIEIYNFSEDFL